MKQLVDLNESKLIAEYKRSKDQRIALYFFDKYKDELVNAMFRKIRNKFSSVPLDRDDFFYYVWKSILNCLKTYRKNKNKSFKNYIFEQTYFRSVREATKFLNNKHIILNNSYSYDRILLKNRNNTNLFVNGTTNINNNSYDLVTKEFINQVVDFNTRYDINELKRVVYLRSLGYTMEEISNKTKLPLVKIRKMVEFACKIAKKLYD